MYDVVMSNPNPLSTDYMIYSPDVPFFRDDRGQLIDYPFTVSVITAAAPNAKECVRPALRGTMKNRLRKVIQAAIAHGNKVLMIGAFGCGVFANDPEVVATVEKELLVDDRLRDHFALVLNPIAPARRDNSSYLALRRVLEPWRP
jgi:uncharacterized protein (TIGR02452 family)